MSLGLFDDAAEGLQLSPAPARVAAAEDLAAQPLSRPLFDADQQTALFSPDEDHFAQRMSFLESSLSASGMGECGRLLCSLLRGSGSEGTSTPLVLEVDQRSALLDCLLDLTRSRSQALSAATQAAQDGERLRSDLAHASVRVSDLKEEKADAERRAWEVEMKRRGESKEALAREKALRGEVAALDKKCVMIQRRDNQYKHELRKTEQAFEKVQEKLHKIILEKTNGSTFGGIAPMGSTQRGAANSAAPNGGWEITSTVKLSARGGGSGNASGGNNANSTQSSSADLELLQGTLATYSERMSQLVTENLSVKAALKQLEHQLQDVLDEPAPEVAEEEQDQAIDENGVPIARELLCLSPRSRQLLADFTPQQIELPWELSGDNVEAVLSAKLQLVRARVKAQREAALSSAAEARETAALDLLKQRISEQESIIREQDVLLRAALAAPLRDDALQAEKEEVRRLSLRVEAEDARRRRAAATGGLPAAPNPAPLASPVTLRILGGRSAANLPVLATPVFQPRKMADVVLPSGGPSKSKWLAGGVVMTPTFTPSKRSMLRAGATLDDDSDVGGRFSAIDLAEEFEFDPRPDEDADSLMRQEAAFQS